MPTKRHLHSLFIVNSFPRVWNRVSGIFYADQALALQLAGYRVGVLVEPSLALALEFWRNKRRFPPFLRQGTIYPLPVYFADWGEIPKSSIAMRVRTKHWMLNHAFKHYVQQHGLPDVIHAQNTIYAGYLASRLSRKYHIPLVITEHSSAFLRGLVRQAQVPYIRQALHATPYRYAVSTALAEALNDYAMNDKPILRLPNIVDTSFFAFRAPQLPSQNVPFRFTIVAGLNANKNHRMLLSAFHRAFPDGVCCLNTYQEPIAVELHIVGDGALRAELEAEVRIRNMDERVVFAGQVLREAVRDSIYQSHCVVSVSHSETFGLSLVEAMACGRPVIATQSGGPNDIVNEHNGILVDVDDVDQLANALSLMVASYTQYDYQQIHQSAQRFSHEHFVKQVSSIYSQLLEEKSDA
jgi:glycosyltransferase involved in cell wall biosynthesis